ncbi:HTH-type transcriptional repressor YcnK [Lentibacillus kapialis]|uniref:HTH-type transcriptional repressor YcnK n=1 Tax=Lentibacillus kapialis TaxID=340214 RepID=A0A917Q104_9BACI|nr:DeoR family transcriptional regulator [Lentibacillus kapialis]GGK04513.1 HTH-type transcriptional repressor YcnK [Lentibacillus kapialis]
MLPIERQHKIKDLLNKHRNMKISDLSARLGVSEMTIHRDLRPLIDDGAVLKTFGGASIAQKANENITNDCVFCSRTINDRLAYRLILSNNRTETACCAHCGLLRHRQLSNDVIQAICPDFFRQTTLSSQLAFYVMDTSVEIGCCHPQVLTFERSGDAEKFVKGFGGTVYRFSEAIEAIFQKMNEHDGCFNSHHRSD